MVCSCGTWVPSGASTCPGCGAEVVPKIKFEAVVPTENDPDPVKRAQHVETDVIHLPAPDGFGPIKAKRPKVITTKYVLSSAATVAVLVVLTSTGIIPWQAAVAVALAFVGGLIADLWQQGKLDEDASVGYILQSTGPIYFFGDSEAKQHCLQIGSREFKLKDKDFRRARDVLGDRGGTVLYTEHSNILLEIRDRDGYVVYHDSRFDALLPN